MAATSKHRRSKGDLTLFLNIDFFQLSSYNLAFGAIFASFFSNGTGLDAVATGAKPPAKHAYTPPMIQTRVTITPAANFFTSGLLLLPKKLRSPLENRNSRLQFSTDR